YDFRIVSTHEVNPSTSLLSTKVLICDDSPDQRDVLSEFLRLNGYQVETAEDGRRSLELIKDREFNAVLLDLNMPDVDGFDVLSYLQEHRRGLSVILISAMPLEMIQRQIRRLPKHELPPLLLKPINLDHLLALLQMELRGELQNLNEST